MSSSVHIDNKKKDTLIFGFGPTQGSDNTMLTAEAQYLIQFSKSNRKFCLRCIAMEATVFNSLMLQKYINSKQDSDIKNIPCF